MAGKSKNLLFHLAALPDPRELRGQRHLLLDVLVIAVLATLCGVDEWEGIEDFALEEEAWLRTFLVLPNGIPSHDTFNRIFRMIDVGAFNACFLEWVKALRKKVSNPSAAGPVRTVCPVGSLGDP
ncbi:MAG TPA: ISAs1 family transposase [Holophaga sp.]|nr:ISAs1 family transposase [Holophaga sp.]